MADNIAVTQGAGTTVSTKEATNLNGGAVAAQHIQRAGIAGINADGTASDYNAANPLPTKRALGANAAITAVAFNAASVALKAANAARRALVILNDTDGVLFLAYGAAASTVAFTLRLEAGESIRETDYSGAINGIWTGATAGNARMTEIT